MATNKTAQYSIKAAMTMNDGKIMQSLDVPGPDKIDIAWVLTHAENIRPKLGAIICRKLE